LNKTHASCAEYYHEETKYDRATIHRFRSLDYSKKPAPFKDYQSDNPISLLPFLPFSYIPFSRTPLPTAPPQPSFPWGLAELSRILFFSYGVTAIMDSPKIEKTYMRAAPSAGGLYPAEIYIVTRDLPFLNDGIYHYQSKEHHLVPLYEGAFWDKISSYFLHQPVLNDGGFLILVSGMYERSSWRYGERGYRRILLDSGHLLGNLSLMGREAGFLPFPMSGFQDKALNSLLFLGDANEVCMYGLAMVHAESSFDPIPSTPFTPSPGHPPYTPPDTPEVGEIFRDLHRLASIGSEHVSPLSWSDEADYDPLT
jgi:SagB-type dehydrogenase family enzyme